MLMDLNRSFTKLSNTKSFRSPSNNLLLTTLILQKKWSQMDRNESCRQAYRVYIISLHLGIVEAWGSSNADCSTLTTASKNASNTTWLLKMASLTFSTIRRTWTMLGELTENSFVEGKHNTNYSFHSVSMVSCNVSHDHNEDRTNFNVPIPLLLSLLSHCSRPCNKYWGSFFY